MAKTKRVEIDVTKLEQLYGRVQKLAKKDSPAAEAARERIRLAFLSRTKGDGMARLAGAAHCLDLIGMHADSGFQVDPEEQLHYLATAIERLAALAAEVERIQVGP